jgi:hypothetical protein
MSDKKFDRRKLNNGRAGREKLSRIVRAGKKALDNVEEEDDELIIKSANKNKKEKNIQEPTREPLPEPIQEPKKPQKKEKESKLTILVDAMNKLNESQQKLMQKYQKQKQKTKIQSTVSKAIPKYQKNNDNDFINTMRKNLLVKFD